MRSVIMGQGRMICLIAIRLHPPVTTTSRIGLPKGRSEAPGHLISTSLEAMRQVRGQLDELCDVFSPGWLQGLTQSAEVNATFAVSPAKPPDFVAVGPAPGPRAGRGRARRPVSGMLTPAPVGLLQSLTQSAPAHRSTACGSREGLSTTSSRGTHPANPRPFPNGAGCHSPLRGRTRRLSRDVGIPARQSLHCT